MDYRVGGMVLLWVLMVAFYFLPTIVVAARKHHNSAAISVLNLFLGWTLVGWVVALVWSLTAIPKTGE